jgi:hypothetical protein
VDDCQFGYTTQLEKENPDAPGFIDLRQLQGNWNSYTKKSTSCDGPREIAVKWTSDTPEGTAFPSTSDTLGL